MEQYKIYPVQSEVSKGNLNMARVEIENVDKNYGAIKILKNISVSVKDGEFLVLVGPSGCGKSTLLRMISGLENISAGKIYMVIES